jgi:diadenylate cyclase
MLTAFITFRWIDFIDILLVAFLLFQLYKLVKGTVAINIFVGILAFYMLWLIVRGLNMQLLPNILGEFIRWGAIILIIVFQQELRRFLLLIGTTGFFDKGKFRKNLFEFNWGVKKPQFVDVNTVVKACSDMAESYTGALIVIATRSELKFFANTGDYIDAVVSKRLIESIFFKNNPMHDGAIIISGNRIKATRCVLPVTENPDFPHHLGMRHRAAVGITEASDAVAIVVSEQTGTLSYAKQGELKTNLSADKLKELLNLEFA